MVVVVGAGINKLIIIMEVKKDENSEFLVGIL